MLNKIKEILRIIKLKKETKKKLKAKKRQRYKELKNATFTFASLPYGTYVFQFKDIGKNAYGTNDNYDNKNYNNLGGRYVELFVYTDCDTPSQFVFRVDKVIGYNTITCKFLKCIDNDVGLSEEALFNIFVTKFLSLPDNCNLMNKVNAYNDM